MRNLGLPGRRPRFGKFAAITAAAIVCLAGVCVVPKFLAGQHPSSLEADQAWEILRDQSAPLERRRNAAQRIAQRERQESRWLADLDEEPGLEIYVDLVRRERR